MFAEKTGRIFFGQHGFSCRNILKSSNLSIAFKKFDALLLVTPCSNGVLPCLESQPWLKSTLPKLFPGRKVGRKRKKTVFAEGKWNFFLILWPHADWKVCQFYLVAETTKTRSFDIYGRSIAIFFRMSFRKSVFGYFPKLCDILEKFLP